MSVSLTRRTLLAAAPAAGLVFSAAAQARNAVSADGALWRGMALEDQAGRTVQLGNTKASFTLVTMWAHWCQGCHIELGPLTALQAAMGPRFEVMLLSHPEWWRQDLAVTQQRHIPLRHVVPSASNDPAVVRAALTPGGAFHVPRSLVLRNADSQLAWSRDGWTDWSSTEAQAQMRNLAA